MERSAIRDRLALPEELEEGVYAGKVVKRRDVVPAASSSDSESGSSSGSAGSSDDTDADGGDDDGEGDAEGSGSGSGSGSSSGSGSDSSDGASDDDGDDSDDEVGKQLALLAQEDEISTLQLRKEAADDVQPTHTRNQMVRSRRTAADSS